MDCHYFSLEFVLIFVYLTHVFAHKLLNVEFVVSSAFRHVTFATLGTGILGDLGIGTRPVPRSVVATRRSARVFLFDLVQLFLLFSSQASFFLFAQDVGL